MVNKAQQLNSSLKDLGLGGGSAKISGIEFLSNNVFFQKELYFVFFYIWCTWTYVHHYLLLYDYVLIRIIKDMNIIFSGLNPFGTCTTSRFHIHSDEHAQGYEKWRSGAVPLPVTFDNLQFCTSKFLPLNLEYLWSLYRESLAGSVGIASVVTYRRMVCHLNSWYE